MELENLRRTYLPSQGVRVLFVGESPPAGGTFFYAADSTLFRATRDAFSEAFAECADGATFLERFAARGCFLYDLCAQPVNHLTGGGENAAKRRAAHRAGEAALAQTIVQLRPRAIVVLLKSIAANVARSIAAAGWEGEMHVVTYPSRWHAHRAAYTRELTPLLRDLSRRGVLDDPAK